MSKRTVTQYWKENKDYYPFCLCYTPEKGLFIGRFFEDEESQTILLRCHGIKYRNTMKCEVPEIRTSITINSDFTSNIYGYLNASIETNGHLLLDFDTEKLYVLNQCSIKTIRVPNYEWEDLFNRIIIKWRNSSSNIYDTSIIGYIDAISEMLDQDEISVKGYLYKDKYTTWKGKYIITLHAGNKIYDLLANLEKAKPIDDVVKKHLKKLCIKFLNIMASLQYNLEDSRLSQLSATLLAIHKFLNQIKEDKEYLKYILANK